MQKSIKINLTHKLCNWNSNKNNYLSVLLYKNSDSWSLAEDELLKLSTLKSDNNQREL